MPGWIVITGETGKAGKGLSDTTEDFEGSKEGEGPVPEGGRQGVGVEALLVPGGAQFHLPGLETRGYR